MKNNADTEDVFQNVFVKYLLYEGVFESTEHEKAWFIRVTVNACKDHLRSLFRRREQPLDILCKAGIHIESDHHYILEAVLSLPEKYRDVIYLHYYEGYSAVEISKLIGVKENTVYSHLSRARAMLKDRLGGDVL